VFTVAKLIAVWLKLLPLRTSLLLILHAGKNHLRIG